MSAATAVRLVARREIVERAREKSFLVSTGITVVIVVLIAVLPNLLGLGGEERYTVGVADPRLAATGAAAERGAAAFDAEVTVERVAPAEVDAALSDGELDAVLTPEGIRTQDETDSDVVSILQAASRDARAQAALEQAGLSGSEQQSALAPAPLAVTTVEAQDPNADAKSAFAFVAVLVLFGQLLVYGIWVATGIVEEKTSRVIEVLLSTVKPSHLLAGKIIGLGLLGLAQILVVTAVGLGAAAAAGAIELDADVVSAALLALAWFVVGYAFYACAYACAGALVPRQEELQSALDAAEHDRADLLLRGLRGDPGSRGDGREGHDLHPVRGADDHAAPDRAGRGVGVRDRRGAGGDARGDRAAGAFGGPHLPGRGAADGLGGQAARGVAGGSRLMP